MGENSVTGGSVDDVNKIMRINVSGGGTYIGTITQNKNFSGSWRFGIFSLGSFSLSYIYPTGD